MSSYRPVIGIEVHVELKTKTKMFCACPADHFGKPPNTQTCPTCLGLPGALPVPNKQAIGDTIKLGLAFSCQINKDTKFDRKNYFYPDLPKGYQISQYDKPISAQGHINLSSGQKIRIRRIHLEEDTAKLSHQIVAGQKTTLIDFNRSGVPLVEIVTEPDFSGGADVDEFVKEVQLIIRRIGISTADMEKGSLRLEANVSVRKPNQKSLPTYKVELKNLNSFRFVKKAIDYEISRQSQILSSGKLPLQETRGYNQDTNITYSQRYKEEARDYRYFPEPDIPPLKLSPKEIDQIKETLPELPQDSRKRLAAVGLPQNFATVLAGDEILLELFDLAASKDPANTIEYANTLVNKRYGSTLPQTGEELINFLQSQKRSPVDQSDLGKAIAEVLDGNPRAVSDYKSGKVQTIGFLIGQVSRKLKGTGDPSLVREKLLEKLSQ